MSCRSCRGARGQEPRPDRDGADCAELRNAARPHAYQAARPALLISRGDRREHRRPARRAGVRGAVAHRARRPGARDRPAGRAGGARRRRRGHAARDRRPHAAAALGRLAAGPPDGRPRGELPPGAPHAPVRAAVRAGAAGCARPPAVPDQRLPEPAAVARDAGGARDAAGGRRPARRDARHPRRRGAQRRPHPQRPRVRRPRARPPGAGPAPPRRGGAAVPALRLSPRTVSKHLQRSYARLGVPNRAAAVALLR
jgi:hypothetical protein